MLHLILLIVALVLFVGAAAGARFGTIALGWLGLAVLTAAFLVP